MRTHIADDGRAAMDSETRSEGNLVAIARAAGWSFGVHSTDHAPESALMGLYLALAPDRAGRGRAA